MKEIEILVTLKDTIEDAKKALSEFEYQGAKHTLDIYFYDPLRENLKLNSDNKILECCRIRTKNNINYITYKIDVYDGDTWSHSDEYETQVEDADALLHVFNALGLKELVRIDNTKHTYINDTYEIVVEDVRDLGCFLEVELLNTPDDIDVTQAKNDILSFIKDLGLDVGEELNSGKPELMLIKNKQQ